MCVCQKTGEFLYQLYPSPRSPLRCQTSPLRRSSQPLRRPSSPLRCPGLISGFPQCAYYQAHLGRRIGAQTGRNPQSGQAVTQAGGKVNPLFQFAIGGIGTKPGVIEQGKFGTPIGTDFKRVHIRYSCVILQQM